MTRRRWAAVALGTFLVAVVLAVWVIPTVQGPEIDCEAGLSAQACDAYVSQALANAGPQTMPITRIYVEACGAYTATILVWWPVSVAACGLQ